MAGEKEIIFKAKLDTSESVQDIIELKQKMDELSETKDIPAVNKFEQMNEMLKKNTFNISELNQAIEVYQNIALQAGEDSPVGRKAIEQAAQLTRRVDTLNQQIGTLAERGRKMRAAMQLGNTLVQGYQAFTGITALMGDENERLLEIFAKMQIVQQSLAAVEEVRAALDKQTILSTQARAMWTNALNLSMKLFGKTQATATKGTKLFGKALVSTGIGAIVVLLGLLVANFDKVVKWVKKASFWFIDLAKKIPFVKEAIEAVEGAIESIIVAFGGLSKAERERVKAIEALLDAERKRRTALEESYNEEIALAKARGEDTYKLEQERLKALRDSIRTELKLLMEKRKITGEWSDEELQRVKEQLKEFKKLNLEIKTNAIRHAREIAEIEKKKQKKLADERRKAWEKKQAEEKERKQKELEQEQAHAEAMLELQHRYEDALLQQQFSGYELELEQLREKHQREIDELKSKGLTEQQLQEELAVLKLAQQIELENMQAEHDAEVKEQKNERVLTEHEEELARFGEFEMQKFDLARQYAQQELEAGVITKEEYAKKVAEIEMQELETVRKIEKAKFNAKMQSLDAIGGLINALGGLMAQGSKQQKAFALTGILIDEAKAIANAAVMAGEAATASGPAAPFTYVSIYASLLATTLSNFAKAKSLLGKAAPAPVSVDVPSVSAPDTGNGIGTNASGQQSGGQTQGQGVGFDNITKVVVVESDITDTQLANAEVKEASNI